MFGGRFDEAHGYGEDGEPVPRYNFDYFGPATITCFILITGSWYDSAVVANSVTGPVAFLYFTCALVVGFYISINLFVAILLESFASVEEEVVREDRETAADKPIDGTFSLALPRSAVRAWHVAPCIAREYPSKGDMRLSVGE